MNVRPENRRAAWVLRILVEEYALVSFAQPPEQLSSYLSCLIMKGIFPLRGTTVVPKVKQCTLFHCILLINTVMPMQLLYPTTTCPINYVISKVLEIMSKMILEWTHEVKSRRVSEWHCLLSAVGVSSPINQFEWVEPPYWKMMLFDCNWHEWNGWKTLDFVTEERSSLGTVPVHATSVADDICYQSIPWLSMICVRSRVKLFLATALSNLWCLSYNSWVITTALTVKKDKFLF